MNHQHVFAATSAARSATIHALGLDGPVIDAHRRRRGPYTAAGQLIELLVSDAPAELLRRHEVEILSIAPQLHGAFPTTHETLTTLAVPAERTRFYSALRTLRLAHGLTEFIRDVVRATRVPRTLILDNLDAADPTDIEFAGVLLRRIDPALLQVVVCTATDMAVDGTPFPFAAHAQPRLAACLGSSPERSPDVASYMDGDCLSDDPLAIAAYDSLDDRARRELHDRRAAALAADGDRASSLGALPFHRERGSDPKLAVVALLAGLEYCVDMGFYDATVDFAVRGRALTTWDTDLVDRWAFTTKMTTSLAALGRASEAELIYDEIRAASTKPLAHLQAAYATAMLYTRHHEPSVRDNNRAKGYINEAIAIASLLDDPKERAFETVFNNNGLALIEVHLGQPHRALALLDDGITRLDRELKPHEHRLHRSVLRYNRAQVYAALGRVEDAINEFSAVIDADPHYPEYYFDRGILHRRHGDPVAALADFQDAIRLSPPFPEVYYNRGDTLAELGDLDAARHDFGYVLELDPTYVDAYVSRAALATELGDLASARSDVVAGLAHQPGHARLLCLAGQLDAAEADSESALRNYDAALAADVSLIEAWISRASLHFDRADFDAAIDDLDQALERDDNPVARFNRATALQRLGRWDEALADLTQALALDPDDTETVEQYQLCREHLAAELSTAAHR